ncbi:MAG TPA: DNA primase [Thermomicrobiales bacterium]|jgi:DNA primase|nr:DNA primase [Thermomicrobiales bacterium]
MARDSVAEVREQTDIVDLVEQYVQLKRAGSSYKGLCPFHQEKSPSFVVFPQSGTFNCFGCGKRGDALTFYQEVERVDFREALHELARRANITLSTAPVKDPAEQDRRQRLIAANDAAARLFQRAIGVEQGQAGRELAERRGIDAAMMRAFRIGYSPDSWDTLLRNLGAQGFDADIALEAGLVIRNDAGRTYDRFRGRLMFPIADRDGDIVGFGGRALGDEQPKYLNSPQTPLFDKSGLLYGLHLAKDAIRERGEVVVVEGYMDVVTAHQFGHRNVVAAMGTALTEAQVNLVKRFAPRIILALDADAAGQAAMVRGIETMTGGGDGRESGDRQASVSAGLISAQQRSKTEIRVATMPVGKDPDELIRRDPDLWEQVIAGARPVVDWLIDAFAADVRLDDAASKSSAIQRMLPILRQLPDRIQQHHYATIIGQRFGVTAEIVLRELASPSTAGRRGTRGQQQSGESQGGRGSSASGAGWQQGGNTWQSGGQWQGGNKSKWEGGRDGQPWKKRDESDGPRPIHANWSPGDPPPRTRRRELDNESYLVGLLIAFRPYLEPLLAETPDDLINDGRNRELLRLLRSEECAGLFGSRLIIALPDELADYADRLNISVGGDEDGRLETDLEREEGGAPGGPRLIPKRYPGEVRTEAMETLRQLRRQRFEAAVRHLQEEIRVGMAERDLPTVSSAQQRLAELSQERHHFDPPISPVFKDTRTPTGP